MHSPDEENPETADAPEDTGTDALVSHSDPLDTPPQGIPLPIVGMPVQYYTHEAARHSPRQAHGPYAATITEVIDADSGLVCLFVKPPFHPGYDVANVKYGALTDDVDDSWLTATFY